MGFRNGLNCKTALLKVNESQIKPIPLGNHDKDHSKPMLRGGPFIKTWETFWTDPASGPQAIMTASVL